MKSMLALLVGFGLSSMAHAGDIATLRQEISQLQKNSLSSLIGECNSVHAVMTQYQVRIQAMQTQVLTLGMSAQDNQDLADAMANLNAAQRELPYVTSDCHNTPGMSDSAILVEMYLSHADTSLMIYQHGVGSDLKAEK